MMLNEICTWDVDEVHSHIFHVQAIRAGCSQASKYFKYIWYLNGCGLLRSMFRVGMPMLNSSLLRLVQ